MLSGRVCFLLTRRPVPPNDSREDSDEDIDEDPDATTADLTSPLATPTADDVTTVAQLPAEDYQQYYYIDDVIHPDRDERLDDLRAGQRVTVYLTVAAMCVSAVFFLAYCTPTCVAYYRRRRDRLTLPIQDPTVTSSSSSRREQQQQQFRSAPPTSKYAKPPPPPRPPKPATYFSSLWSRPRSVGGSMVELHTLPSNKLFDDPSTSTFRPSSGDTPMYTPNESSTSEEDAAYTPSSKGKKPKSK